MNVLYSLPYLMENLDPAALQQAMEAITTAAENSGDPAAVQQAMMMQNMMTNNDLGMILGRWAGVLGVIALLALVLILIPMCKMFSKMWNNWYEALIPGHNCYVFITNAGKPGWWIFLIPLFIIPVAGWILAIVLHFIISIWLANKFGKGTGFGVGMAILPFIFFPILGYGSSTYTR